MSFDLNPGDVALMGVPLDLHSSFLQGPAFAPGVSHHEPGGLSTREVINLIHRFKGQLVGADIVELNPHRDPYGMTAMVAAKFVKEIGARLLSN